MTSAKFVPLNQSDDYRVDEDTHGVPRLADPALYRQQLHDHHRAHERSPPMYSAIHTKTDYHVHDTYVSTPIDSFDDSTSYRREARRKSSRLSFLGKGAPVSNFKIPTFAAPWQHEQVDPSKSLPRMNTVRYFDRDKQWWRLFSNGIIQWFMTASIVAMICIALWGFQQIKPMDQWLRYTFNAVMTLLSLCLGLAIVTALRSYARLLSWRFLASEYRNLQDFELVMNCDSQSKVLKLLWAGRTQGRFWLNKTQILCIISLGLVIGLQIVIALLGLTYSVDSSDEYTGYVYGNLSRVDLSNIQQNFDSGDSSAGLYYDEAGAANFYGDIGGTYGYYYGKPGFSQFAANPNYTTTQSIGVNGDNEWVTSFFYEFFDMAAGTTNSNWGVTKRYITSEASCTQLEITAGGMLGNDTVQYNDENGLNQTQWLYGEIATYTSTYMTNTSSGIGCGPRCSKLLILDVGSDPTDANATFIPPVLWGCNSTVNQVTNAKLCKNETACEMEDDLARIAAGAIGLSGIARTGEDMQFQLYPQASLYSYWTYYMVPYNGSDNQAMDVGVRASLVAWFSIGVLAAMDNNGPRIFAMGNSPRTGMVLDVQWRFTIPVLAIVPGVQLVVLIIVCVWANGAMVKDGSYLATARLLRPVVERLEEHGCALTGDEIARELGNFKIIYGARAPKSRNSTTAYTPMVESDADWHCGIIQESEGFGDQAAEGWSPGHVWPAGRYDGAGYTDQENGCSECLSRQRRGVPVTVAEETTYEEKDEDVIDEKAHLL